MLLAIAALIVGIALLLWSADRFVDAAAAIARNLRVPSMLIGLTIVSLGTSLPEMVVGAIASLAGNRDLAIGNVFGSNIANIGLVLGVTALIVPLVVKSIVLRREMPALALSTLLALLLMLDGSLTRLDGVALTAGFIIMLFWLARIAKRNQHDPLLESLTESPTETMPTGRAAIWFIIALALLIGSSRIIVWGAVIIAQQLGISDLMIGLTIVAIGTSLPELIASVVSALKQETDLAIGNVIGSNMFNLLAVLAMPAWIDPGAFSRDILWRDFPVMLAFTLLLFLVAFALRRQDGIIQRIEGALLSGCFIAYLTLLYAQS